jgi:hypothetical protein
MMSSKRLLSIILALGFISAAAIPVLGQGTKPFTQFRFGTLNPNDTKAGLILGVRTGRDFDQRVLVGFSADLFWKKFTRESTVSSDTTIGGVHYTTMQRTVDYTTLILPLMITIDVQIPVENLPIKPYFGGGIGYQLLFNKEDNYEQHISDSRFYSGFGFQFEVGAEYQMSPSTGLTLEAFYNGCKAKRGGGTSLGLPTWEEVDISGMGFRLGIVLRGWGI